VKLLLDTLRVDPRLLRRGLIDNDYDELPITSEHAVVVAQYPGSIRKV
jgi:hypothetical protein